MSSSSGYERPDFSDLHGELPDREGSNFVEENEFATLDSDTERLLSTREAREAGMAEGEKLGRAAAMQELAPVIEQLQTTARALADARRQRLDDAASEIVEVATELARRILRGELQQPDDVVLRMARSCIDEASDEGDLLLRVSPDHAELIRLHLPELESELGERSLRIQSDAGIEPGCVVLETARRCYDGRPERMLDDASARARDVLPDGAVQ